MRSPIRSTIALSLILVTAAASAACARNSIKGANSAATDKGNTQNRKVVRGTPGGSPTPVGVKEPGVEVRTSTGALFVAPGLENTQRKTLPLLQSSIANCLSANQDVFALSPTMVAPPGAAPTPDAQGKIPFLNSGYLTGPDGPYATVFDAERDFLDDPSALRRASVNANALDDLSYMVAAMTVANVVSFNVGLEAIECYDEEKARQFLERCLPGEENAILDEAARKLAAKEACGSRDYFARRKALATFLSSYLFLRAR